MTECIHISPWTCIDDHVKKPAPFNVRYAIRQSMTYMAYSLPRCCVASNRLFSIKDAVQAHSHFTYNVLL